MLDAEQKTFGALSHNANRPAGFLGQDHRGRFQFGIELAAKAAAEGKHDHAHVGDGNFEDARQLALDDMGILIARPDGDATVGDLGDDDVGFERDVIDRRRIVGVFENLLGFAKTLIEIAFTLLEEMDDICSFQRTRRDIGAPGNDSTRPG